MGCCLRAWGTVLGLVVLGLIHPSLTRADEGCEDWAARLVSLQGSVEQRDSGETGWSRSSPDARLCPGDNLRIGANSRASILLPNETLVRLDQLTSVVFPKPEAQEQNLLLDVLRGIGYFFSRTPKKIKIRAPFVNAAVEGTEFLVSAVSGGVSRVGVFEGQVRVTNPAGELLLASGEEAVAGSGQAPQKRLIANPRDAVAWALYYPPVIDYPLREAPEEIRTALDHFNRGDVAAASAALDRVPRRRRGVEFHTLRASILLFVGQVETARLDLEAAVKQDPENANALALQSIVALVLDKPDQADRLARRGADSSPQAAAPQIALSYVHQSRFDLDQARESARSATESNPQNALAWARLAELDLALGELDAARRAAETATSLNSDLSRTQTTLGFAQLVRFDTDEAANSFRQAIEFDQADPLPHLGLGLTLIKKNDLEAGRKQIEIAATLDPNNSLIRSYLGKAYYEEKRDPLDGRQFDLAKQLDPHDPTPWLYDAIRKQTLNRPAEALADLNKSVALNDNRAVFRSQFQLDQDLATRSTSLARAYRDLGFENRGFLKGWQSLDVDPGNFSAHRFLADTYAGMPRHEIARQSELLQSQLRQPLVIHPVQTQIGELGTFIQQDIGPRDAAFNEYTPLFARNRPALQVNGIVGSNNTWGDEILLSAIAGRASFSVGQFHYETDGHRPNADQQQDGLVAFAQLAMTPSTNLQVEARRTEIERGDLSIRIDPDDFFPDLREKIAEDIFRIGFRHEFSTRSDLIGSYWHQTTDDDLDFGPGDAFFSAVEGDQEELQHLYRFRSSHLRTGGSYFEGTRRDTNVFEGEPVTSLEDQTDASVYTYANIRGPGNLNLTLGLSAQSTEGGIVDSDQLNPKFGLVWNAGERRQTTLRLAAFRTLQRTITADQTLEPTTIAGFNQFYDDAEGTDAWRYGLGLDHKFNESWFGGLEYSHRDLTVPGQVFTPSGTTVAEGDMEERFGRAYLYWLPHTWWSFSGVLSREEFEREEGFTGAEEILDLTTDHVALGAKFFHPSGFRANLIANYVSQDGTFGFGPPFGEFVDDGDDFWIVDLALGYRLPRRSGLITFGVKNLFDEDFRFQDTDLENPRFVPDRFAFARVTLSF